MEGIFALLGVVVGGLIAAGTGYWMERKREDREVQLAARRAFIDLYACYLSIRGALEQEGFVEVNEIRARLGRYREHDSTFAVHLRICDYLEVSRAVRRLWCFIAQAEARRAPELTDDARRELEPLRRDARRAVDILLEVAIRGPEHTWGQRKFRDIRRLVRPEEKKKSEILKRVEEVIQLPPIPQPDSREYDGPERRSPDNPRSC